MASPDFSSIEPAFSGIETLFQSQIIPPDVFNHQINQEQLLTELGGWVWDDGVEFEFVPRRPTAVPVRSVHTVSKQKAAFLKSDESL